MAKAVLTKMEVPEGIKYSELSSGNVIAGHVVPEEQTTEAVAHVYSPCDQDIRVESPKDKKIIAVLKDYGFGWAWDDKLWRFNIDAIWWRNKYSNEEMVEKIRAEVCELLIEAGIEFTVDPNMLKGTEMALKGDVKLDDGRWLARTSSWGYTVIQFPVSEMDKWQKACHNLKGKWDSYLRGYRINPSFIDDAIEFAEENGFKISPEVTKMQEKMQEEMAAELDMDE